MSIEILWPAGTPPAPRIPGPPKAPSQLYRWAWRARLPERHGQLCRVPARGALNSCLVLFADGARFISSRNALRRADGAPSP